MTELQIVERSWAPLIDIEIRRHGDGRTVYGLAVPFDSPTPIRDGQGDYTEIFRHGSFTKTINDGVGRIKFLVNHDRTGRLPLGRAVSLVEDPSGLVGEFRVSNTRQGDEVLELIRDGALDAFSIGFRPIRDAWNSDRSLVERTEVALSEVSTVAFPAYDGAKIAGLRADVDIQQHLDDDAATDAAHAGTSEHLDDKAVDSTFAARRRLRLHLGVKL